MELRMNIKYSIRWPKELILKRTQYMIDATGREVVRGIRKNIITQTGVIGGRFRRLKPDTIRRKSGLRYPKKALYALGVLYRSIHYFTGHRPNQGTVGIMDRGSPSRRRVALYQQTGSYPGGVARRFFGIGKQTRENLRRMWKAWFRSITRRAELYKKGAF